jgi:hypothetical protein
LGVVWKLPLRAIRTLPGHVALGEADFLGAGAVDIDGELGQVEGLLDARVGGAGDVLHVVQAASSA